MSSDLPTSISYLQPVVDELVAIGAEQIDEDFDVSQLIAVLASRVAGLSVSDAQRRIQSDRKHLLTWLKAQDDHPAHFIAAFIEPPEVANRLVAQDMPKKKEKPKPTPAARAAGIRKVILELPSPFVTALQGKTLVFMSPTVGIILMPVGLSQLEAMQVAMAAQPTAIAAEVVLGSITGLRISIAGRNMYFLNVEGQGVQVNVDSGGKPYDVAEIEAHLAKMTVA